MEIERKYLVKKIPGSLSNYEMQKITQAYLCADPVIRVRKTECNGKTEYILTVKGRGMVVREEHELALSQEKYALLLGKREGRILGKERYRIPLAGGYIAELDIYEGEYQGLCTVEVEFDNEEEMLNFEPPEWFGMDVSEEAVYKNSFLCMSESSLWQNTRYMDSVPATDKK